MVGVGAGLGHALALLNFDRAMRRPRDVEQKLGLQCLGMVPLISGRQKKAGRSKLLEMAELILPVAGRKSIPTAKVDLTYKVVNDPFSHYSESLRSIKTSLDVLAMSRPMQCIGIISASPSEGKSTISINLANLYVTSKSTLLIDGDMRNPELTRRVCADVKSGLVEAILGTTSITKVTHTFPHNGLAFVPTVLQQRIANTGDILASDRMRSILADARKDFQQIIIDLPPLGAVSDARAASPMIDAYIVVANWGHTRFEVLEEAIANLGIAADKIAGVILNKVDFTALYNMDAYSHSYYYNKNYAKYGYTYAE
jgi:succinoglycan biosynthesis transport protein ExoP